MTKQSQLRARRNLTIAANQIQKFAAKANEKDTIKTRILLGNRCLVSRKTEIWIEEDEIFCEKLISCRVENFS